METLGGRNVVPGAFASGVAAARTSSGIDVANELDIENWTADGVAEIYGVRLGKWAAIAVDAVQDPLFWSRVRIAYMSRKPIMRVFYHIEKRAKGGLYEQLRV